MILHFIYYYLAILHSHFPPFLCVKTITKLNQGERETFDIKIKQLAFVVHVLQITQSFHVVVLQRTAKKCTKIYNARAQPLLCSLHRLFSDVPVDVAVVIFSVPVHTYSGIFESATLSFRIQKFPRPHVAYSNRICPSTRIRWYPDSLKYPGLLCNEMSSGHAT